ncbi:hypothetical protein DENSPDRAFT_855718, partial [Dentipellis sp. KUC8613]
MERCSEDENLGRFASFFFILEAKGIKLETQSTLDERADPWKMLTEEYVQLDWDYMVDHANGELLVDLAVSFHPVSTVPMVVSGFTKGRVHHANTLNGYGSLSAPMSSERSRRTHVLHRMSYNLCYEAIRPKDNQPYLCSDGDAYTLNDTWREGILKRTQVYAKCETKSYGVRDEYRIGGMAVETVMSTLQEQAESFVQTNPILWIRSEVWFRFLSRRLEEIQAAQITLYKTEPSNYGVVTGLLMYMARASESTPMYVPRHVLDSLQSIGAKASMDRFGMLFLHDLDIQAKDNAYVLLEEEDTADVLASFGRIERRKAKAKARGAALPTSDEYPLGSEPTMTELRHAIHHEPWNMMVPFMYLPVWERDEEARMLFMQFTGQMFLFLAPGWFTDASIREGDPKTLEDAMELWTPAKLYESLTHGTVQSQRQPSFRERMEIYFPEGKGAEGRGKQWEALCKGPGFIARYGRIVE